MKLLLALCVLLLLPQPAERKRENPLEHLSRNIEVLTHFGERADISPDNQRVAFMDKSFGDAMLIDLKTRVTICVGMRLKTPPSPGLVAIQDGEARPETPSLASEFT